MIVWESGWFYPFVLLTRMTAGWDSIRYAGYCNSRSVDKNDHRLRSEMWTVNWENKLFLQRAEMCVCVCVCGWVGVGSSSECVQFSVYDGDGDDRTQQWWLVRELHNAVYWGRHYWWRHCSTCTVSLPWGTSVSCLSAIAHNPVVQILSGVYRIFTARAWLALTVECIMYHVQIQKVPMNYVTLLAYITVSVQSDLIQPELQQHLSERCSAF